MDSNCVVLSHSLSWKQNKTKTNKTKQNNNNQKINNRRNNKNMQKDSIKFSGCNLQMSMFKKVNYFKGRKMYHQIQIDILGRIECLFKQMFNMLDKHQGCSLKLKVYKMTIPESFFFYCFELFWMFKKPSIRKHWLWWIFVSFSLNFGQK